MCFHGPVTTIDYLYDFGDSWEHRITVSDVRAGDPALAYPRFIRGARNGPPEDCGGLPGFYELLKAREDSTHPDHDDAVDWLKEYNPDNVEETLIGVALGRIIRQDQRRRTHAAK